MTGPRAAPSSFRTRVLLAVGLPLLLLSVGLWMLDIFPPRFFDENWLVNEHGNQLYRAQVLSSGGLPYRDFECQYGPLPLYAWAACSRLVGNTFWGCAVFHLVSSILVIAAFTWWLSAAAPSKTGLAGLGTMVAIASLALTIFFRSPLLLSFGANFEYLSWERLWLIGLAAGWRPLTARTWRHPLWIGMMFFLWQLTKFGGALYGLAAVFATDLLTVYTDRRSSIRLLVSFWFRTSVVCLLGELLRTGIFFAVLPSDLAARSAWPLWAAGTYPYDRLTLWAGWRHFTTYTAPIIVPAFASMCVGGALLFAPLRGRLTAWLPPELLFPTLVPVFFYALGSLNKIGYFGREWLFFQYAWALAPLPILLALRCRPWGWLVPVAAYGLSCLMFLRSLTWTPQPSPTVIIASPIGTVFSSAQNLSADMWMTTQRWLSTNGKSNMCVIDSWSGGSWYAAANQRSPLRNQFFEAGIRSSNDEQELVQKLREIDCLIVHFANDNGPATEAPGLLKQYLARVTSQEIAGQIAKDFAPVHFVGGWVLLTRPVNAGNAGGR